MIGRFLALGCCLLVLAGCDSSQPRVVNSNSPNVTTPSGQGDPHASPAVSPHGMSPMGSPDGMPPMSSPHGMPGMGMERAPSVDAPELGLEVQVGPLHFTAPEGWMRKRPGSMMIAAEFGLPLAEGDQGEARLTALIVGGTVDQNLDRWRGDFSVGADDKQLEEIEVAGRKVLLVDFTDAPDKADGEGTADETQPGDRLLGAIVSTDDPTKNCYLKLTGPAKTLHEQAEKFRAFVESLRTAGTMPQ